MKKYKGGIKLIVLSAITIGLTVISAIIFEYGDNQQVQDIKEDAQQKAQDIIEEKGSEIIDSVVDNGKEVVGKTLKDTGEKLLSEEINPGFYGKYGDVEIGEYNNTILFFTAQWCPSCIALEEHIEKYKNSIPSEVAILKVDFDTNTDLRDKYNVEIQHSFVLIDSDGTQIKKWRNSKTLNEVIDNLN
jgi:thiol-disulfide isomerase/thioredoxin